MFLCLTLYVWHGMILRGEFMRKLISVLIICICVTLCSCATKNVSYKYIPLFDETSIRSSLLLKETETVSFIVHTVQPLSGIEIETPLSTGSTEKFLIEIYSFNRDYAKTVADGKVNVKQELVCDSKNAKQTILFGTLGAGSYLIVVRAMSDQLELTGYEKVSDLAAGCVFLRNGEIQENGSAAISLIFEEGKSTGGVYITNDRD